VFEAEHCPLTPSVSASEKVATVEEEGLLGLEPSASLSLRGELEPSARRDKPTFGEGDFEREDEGVVMRKRSETSKCLQRITVSIASRERLYITTTS